LAVSLPSHSSSILQVHDVSIFGPLKKYFYFSISNYIRANGPNVKLNELAAILDEPWTLANSVSNIQSGFRRVGLYPLNRNRVKENMNQVSLMKEKRNEHIFDSICFSSNETNKVSNALNKVAYLDLAIQGTISNCQPVSQESKFKRSIFQILSQAQEHHSPTKKRKW